MIKEKLIRTFLAVELPQRVKSTVLNLQTTIQAKPRVVKWVKMDNIHLTLRFIGPTPEREVPRISAEVKKAIAQHNDLSLFICGTGVFPKPQRPRVLWLGTDGEVQKLKDLVSDINSELEKLGFPAEEREYSPHITIGRIRYPQKITPDVTNFLNSEYDPIEVKVQSVKYFQSDLVPGGPIYSILGVYQLTPKSAEEN
ncbi:MAG: RNA 2',3'-cyclic phosphodiesterase [Candidatus Marinimicrobia bacterium]|nr:RNA 2',3'-cyclic phosphodiesterase [Candidatus Neomarinimicrobiota bacterium]MBL7047508.1 RNA 2',3'-cyclic phosphodiesterase [Candidatus Neomarinimicrobiota bacterium]